jgi:hypothetical protein
MEEIPPLSMVETGETGKAWFLSLDNAWFSGRFERRNWGPMWVSLNWSSLFLEVCPVPPIVNDLGDAIGVINLTAFVLGKRKSSKAPFRKRCSIAICLVGC